MRLKDLYVRLNSLLKARLWLQVLVGLLLGALVGALIQQQFDASTADTISNWVALPGTIFIKLIKLIMIPLVVSSIIRGLCSSESIDQLKKMGAGVGLYFVFSTSVAITIGLTLASFIGPGKGSSPDMFPRDASLDEAGPAVVEFENVPQFISNMLPNNPLQSLATGEMLGIVITSIIFGVALFSIKDYYAKMALDFLGAIQELSMIIVEWSMRIAPLAVFGLIAKTTAQTGGEALLKLGEYVLTVLAGLFCLLIVYMLFVSLLARRNPLDFLRKIYEVQLLAFSTSSSAAVMPLSMKTAEDKLGVKPAISQFVIPIGATINMDGTALYQGVAAIFLAQLYAVDLSMGALVLMVVTVVLASIGTPATPGVGIIILASVLQQAGIPAAGIGLILGVDRILDMSRTTINVTGDLTACVVFNRWFGKSMGGPPDEIPKGAPLDETLSPNLAAQS